jgi:hypothetical protein
MIPTARIILTRPPTGRYVSPALPSDCFAIDFPGRAISPGEGPLAFHLLHRGQANRPSLRASSEHVFIARSASTKDGCLPPYSPCVFVFLMREEYSSYPLHYYEDKY